MTRLPTEYGYVHANFPKWHFAMLNDHVRNEAIERSIVSAAPAGKIVYEIGTGTGIVALAFARHGAAKVYACECDPDMYRLAKSIVSQSQYADKVVVLFGRSRDVLPTIREQDPPDIIFSETLDCGVVGEGYAEIVADVLALSTSETMVMPVMVEQHGMLISSTTIDKLNRVDNALSVDISALNAYRTRSYFPVKSELHDYCAVSESSVIRRYFYNAPPQENRIAFRATRSEVCHGMLSWFNVDFGSGSISTEPYTGSHWHQAFHSFNDPIDIVTGRHYVFSFSQMGQLRQHIDAATDFSFEQEERQHVSWKT